ncbi:MAG TPA: PBP1A family penicillin-binding protein [Acetobacteraceae bacterium]|nr:PBP1A family penicillin-binding protein [Acetobacteraceae bacterium]
MRGLLVAFLGLMLLGLVVGSGGAYFLWLHFSANLPSVDGLKNYQPKEMSRVFAGNDRLLADLAAERRIFMPINAIPKRVQEAFVSAEDQNFWVHGGIDPAAIVRAGLTDLMRIGTGRRPLGASTITQQVVKNMLLNDRVSLSRKVREALLAIRMQQVMSKQRILELYLNEIYLGMGSYGVAAAAEAYFNKPLDQLDLAQDAFLAALPKAPNNYNPWKYPEAAKARRDWVLDRMADDHNITVAQAAAAKAQPILPTEFHHPAPIPGAEWFTEEVRRELVAKFGNDVTTEGGLMVHTSLDPKLQNAAEKAVRDGLMVYDHRRGGWRGPVTHLAVGSAQDWPAALAKVSAPAGMLGDWRLAVVLSTSNTEAKVGWLSPESQPNAQPQPRTGVLPLSDVAWARAAHDDRLGPRPRRITDVVQDGDVIMIQADPAEPARQAGPMKVALRQIPKVQGALVSMDPTTGRVLAMVGGWSYDMSQFNRATQAQRQPGSSFKPFVYLAAMEKGLSPSQRFLNAPVVLDTPEGKWRPGNYEGTFGGPTSLRVALEESLNLVTIRVAQYIGMRAIANTAEAFGEVTDMPLVLPAAIGAVQTTVLQEAGAYAALAEEGRLVKPSLIDSVQTSDGTVVWRPSGLSCDGCGDPAQPPRIVDQRKQIADPASVYQVIRMMEGVVKHGTGVPAVKGLNQPIAGKTGTTQNWVDAWFSGFTPGLVTVVWVGFDNPRTLGNGEQGAAVAAPIWHDFMVQALKGQPPVDFPQPPGVTLASWDSSRGTRTDAFKPGQTPGASLPLYEGMVASSTPTPGSPGAPPGQDASGTMPAASAQPEQGGGVDASLGGLY